MVIQSLVAARAPLGLDVGAPKASKASCCYAIVAPITLAKWIETLIGATYVEVLWAPPSSPYADATLGQPDASLSGIVEYRLWAERARINFKQIVTLEKQVSQVKEIDPLLLPELWLRHAAARGPSGQSGWDLLIPVYHTPETNKPPIGEDRFDPEKLSYVANQVKNCINVPKGTKQEPVRPRLAALPLPRQCVELFIDLRSPHQHDGHQYSRRRFTLQEQPAGDEVPSKRPRTEPQSAPPDPCLRHHWYVKRSGETTFPLLEGLHSPAKEDMSVILGQLDSISKAKFEENKGRFIKHLSSSHQLAWHDNELCINGKLVRLHQDESESAG
ncbi:uncharacterized protein UTRI_06058 [Ustilago trichophora]|uniref:Uncharacterized protein n=1 Tax=Ustilago trichophora TaxID=86804 RepID=A0A5C3EIN8_9BASI|nr:uncharacterized protein UTRI_06058 [Ustilago trichophora]